MAFCGDWKMSCVLGIAIFASTVLPRVSAAPEAAEDEREHTLVFEAGAAGERKIRGGSANFGPSLSVEIAPIEDWLEIEVGSSALGITGDTELSTDLLFKKPFRISASSEFMIGLGPFVSRTQSGADKGTTHGVEVVLDFMFWRHRKTGWYLEPSWSRSAGSGEQTIGVTGGFLFGWH
jgi:hypothetical protein